MNWNPVWTKMRVKYLIKLSKVNSRLLVWTNSGKFSKATLVRTIPIRKVGGRKKWTRRYSKMDSNAQCTRESKRKLVQIFFELTSSFRIVLLRRCTTTLSTHRHLMMLKSSQLLKSKMMVVLLFMYESKCLWCLIEIMSWKFKGWILMAARSSHFRPWSIQRSPQSKKLSECTTTTSLFLNKKVPTSRWLMCNTSN